jgi:indolepyruvate ferredoxin oxidoreductase alpha subunit
VLISRRPCILAAADIRKWEKVASERRTQLACSSCAEE